MTNANRQTRALKKHLKHGAMAVFGKDPRIILGALFAYVFPGKHASLIESFYTETSSDFVSRMIRHKINHDYYQLDDNRSRDWNIKSIWGQGDAGLKWHIENERRAAEDFSSHMHFKLIFLRALKEHLRKNSFDTLVEIGTGTGFFLDYLCGELSEIPHAPARYIGLDLSEATIDLAKRRNRRPNISFFAVTDTERFIKDHCTARTLFIALGTLEFFRYNDLLRLAQLIRDLPSTAVALCEPVNMDLDTETMSKPRGNLMYSHNYPVIFEHSGYSLNRSERLPINVEEPHYQNVLLIASTP